jgi:tetratricopeptide (TPR) repeat protein
MATLLELAKDAFKNHNYILSCEIYERLLRESGRKSTELYFGYGDSLAKCARIKEALDIYAHICYQLCEIIPVEKLKCLASSIIEFIANKRTNVTSSHLSNIFDNESVDPLCCAICEDILKYPVTSLCGHTFCRECCFGRTKCIVCGQKFPIINTTIQQYEHNQPSSSSTNTNISAAPTTAATTIIAETSPSSTTIPILKNSTITSEIMSINSNNNNNNSNNNNSSSRSNNTENGCDCTETSGHDIDIYQCEENEDASNISGHCGGFEQDILVRRLVEKWWNPHLKASELNEEAEGFLQRNLYDEALKSCNQSLEHGELNFFF